MSLKIRLGFTLIEFIIALAIILLLILLVIPGLGFFNKEEVLEGQIEEIISTLRLARNKTLASEGSQNYGVYFESNQFILFASTTYNPSDPANKAFAVNQDLEISEINFTDQLIFFERLTGNANSNGSLKISSRNNPNQYKFIYIDTSGKITDASPTITSDQDRLKDSRHVHVSFLDNTQGATSLTLYFPTDNFYKNINYQDYLSPEQDEFYWSETFEVGGQGQSLTVHSHLLNSSQTNFCFHRNGDLNTKGFEVFLDGQNIVNFNSDGTFLSGTSLFAQEAESQ